MELHRLSIVGNRLMRFFVVLTVLVLIAQPLSAQAPKAPPAPKYTVKMVAEHTQRMAKSPFVSPTPSSNDKFSIGQSHGWDKIPPIPRHDILAYKITDPAAKDAKTRVVLASGNHNTEFTGSWSLEGALDFLVSDDARAAALRKAAEFYVYPMVNPDGRFTLRGRSNPEMAAQNVTDHNRAWLTTGQFSTIDTIKQAMKKDTGGSAEYLFDFHSASTTHFRVQQEVMASPLVKQLALQELQIKSNVSRGDPGMLRNWSMGKDGLSVPNAFCPEHANSLTDDEARKVGQTYMFALHDLIVAPQREK